MMDEMRDNPVAGIFDLVSESFLPDGNSMGLFIRSSFEDGEFPGKAVLDAGCGTGAASLCFAKRDAAKVVGIDISEKSLHAARRQAMPEKSDKTAFVRADLLKIPFKEGSFDIVFTAGALPYIGDTAECLRELTKVLSPGGTILILSLKKTGWDGLFEFFRKIFARVPAGCILPCSKVLALLLGPISPLILKRQEAKEGKTLQQAIIEAFFVPVRLKKSDPAEIEAHLGRLGIVARQLTPPSLNFCSPATVFIIKGTKTSKKDWDGNITRKAG